MGRFRIVESFGGLGMIFGVVKIRISVVSVCFGISSSRLVMVILLCEGLLVSCLR